MNLSKIEEIIHLLEFTKFLESTSLNLSEPLPKLSNPYQTHIPHLHHPLSPSYPLLHPQDPKNDLFHPKSRKILFTLVKICLRRTSNFTQNSFGKFSGIVQKFSASREKCPIRFLQT